MQYRLRHQHCVLEHLNYLSVNYTPFEQHCVINAEKAFVQQFLLHQMPFSAQFCVNNDVKI